jgi:hypothetical protein
MLAKPFYEVMPWLYLFSGSITVIFVQSTVAYVAGLVLFSLGSIILVMRSNYRRRDSHEQTPSKKVLILPETMYELMPYGYLMASLIILAESNSWLALAACLLILYRGAQVLYLRHRHRSYAWPQHNHKY